MILRQRLVLRGFKSRNSGGAVGVAKRQAADGGMWNRSDNKSPKAASMRNLSPWCAGYAYEHQLAARARLRGHLVSRARRARAMGQTSSERLAAGPAIETEGRRKKGTSAPLSPWRTGGVS